MSEVTFYITNAYSSANIILLMTIALAFKMTAFTKAMSALLKQIFNICYIACTDLQY